MYESLLLLYSPRKTCPIRSKPVRECAILTHNRPELHGQPVRHAYTHRPHRKAKRAGAHSAQAERKETEGHRQEIGILSMTDRLVLYSELMSHSLSSVVCCH